MVAIRRLDDLPAPPDDNMPARPIREHSLDKLDYWGRFIMAAAVVTSSPRAFFGGSRLCADFFAGYGVCQDKHTDQRFWGSALLSLQASAPFDVYLLNDLNPDAAATLAERARAIGVQGAQVFEADLTAENGLAHVRDIAKVVVPWGPKIVVSTGDANQAHVALKLLAPAGRRYICAVIDPESAIYEWQALEALTYGERAMDVLMLFPDEMDLGRGLAYYLRGGEKLDRLFPPGTDWRALARSSPHAPSALRRLYEEEMERLLNFRIGHPKTVSLEGRALYRLVFASRDQLGIKIWNDICRKTRDEQYELPLDV
jgi:three-Cys-motif partner protein